jgi:hypothetical protein
VSSGQSVYDEQVLYLAHNVTQALKPGCFLATVIFVVGHTCGATGINAIGALLGNSKWGYLDIYTNRTAAVSMPVLSYLLTCGVQREINLEMQQEHFSCTSS